MMAVSIRPVTAADRAEWDRLYAGYADFYAVTQTAAMRDRVWSWLTDREPTPGYGVEGLVASAPGGQLAGLAHYRPFARPLAAATGGFLDDLFVDPAFRGQNIGQHLIEAVAEVGRQRGWTIIRWITARDNRRAQRIYDRIAERTDWVTYDIDLSAVCRHTGSDRAQTEG